VQSQERAHGVLDPVAQLLIGRRFAHVVERSHQVQTHQRAEKQFGAEAGIRAIEQAASIAAFQPRSQPAVRGHRAVAENRLAARAGQAGGRAQGVDETHVLFAEQETQQVQAEVGQRLAQILARRRRDLEPPGRGFGFGQCNRGQQRVAVGPAAVQRRLGHAGQPGHGFHGHRLRAALEQQCATRGQDIAILGRVGGSAGGGFVHHRRSIIDYDTPAFTN